MLITNDSVPYSQNFISNTKLIGELLIKSDISDSDTVLDIGAGKGSITKQLAARCKEVVAVEIDTELFKVLAEEITEPNVKLVNTNILEIILPDKEYKVFSNIPFNYSSRIMDKLFFQGNPPVSAYIIMQKETCDIFLGKPRETQKSLLLKPFFEIGILHRFDKSDFSPKPRVDSYMLSITKLQNPHVKTELKDNYYDFIVYGATQCKLTLKKNLSAIFTNEQFNRLSQKLGFSTEAKPLDLSCEQWVELFNYFQIGVTDTKKQAVLGSYLKHKVAIQKYKKFYRSRKFGIHM